MENESGTSAVLEPKAAETPAEKSPLSPEVSQSPKEGVTPAEKPPVEGKSSQEPPSPDASKDENLPFNEHPRWKEVYGENKEHKKFRDDLAELGVKSKEDIETLIADAETSEQEAHKAGVREVTDWIKEKPSEFVADLRKSLPDTMLAIRAQLMPEALFDAAEYVRRSDPAMAAKLEELAGMRWSANGGGAPEKPGNADSSERTAIQTEKQSLFESDAWGKFTDALESKVSELSNGLEFRSEREREVHLADVRDVVAAQLYKNSAFQRELGRLKDVRNLSPSQLRDRVRAVVSLHMKYVGDGMVREKVMEKANALKVPLAQKQPDGKDERREVAGAGAPPKGQGLTSDVLDQEYAALEAKGLSGHRLSEAWAVRLNELERGNSRPRA